MKIGGLIGIIIGLGLSAWLLESYGFSRILDLLRHAGWFGILVVIAFHLVQLLYSAMAWRAIASGASPRPELRTYITMRWIREGVNNLLPVAQIGGEVDAARLLQRRAVPLAPAIAGTVADLTMEMVTQIVFTIMGLLLLLHSVDSDSGITNYVISGIVVGVVVAICFLSAQWFGLAALIERGLMKIGRSMGWAGTANVEGLHAALINCYRSPRRLAWAASWHSVSWLLGGVEVCLALHFLGHDVGIVPGLVIESIGQALKAVGFAVPGALGVQEGGFIIICQVFGLSPEVAIALSLMKRLREVGLGVPGLLAWQRLEARPSLAAPLPAEGVAP